VRSLSLEHPPADWVLMNGKVATVDGAFSIREAVAIKGGRFVAVGGDGEMRRWTGPRTRIVNLGGRTVIPGLIDSHMHLTATGLSWEAALRWEFIGSLAEGLRRIAAAAAEKPMGSWIVVGGGWTATQFSEGRIPTRWELDSVAPKHPVYVQYLKRGAILNSAALAAAGIDRHTPDPPGGEFARDPKTGELTGALYGVPVWQNVYNKIPSPALDKVRQNLLRCFRELHRLGLTSVGDIQSAGVNFAHRRLLADMARTGELTLRIRYFVTAEAPDDELGELRRLAAEVKQLPQNDMFRFAGFAEILHRGIGIQDEASKQKGVPLEAKANLRQLAGFLARSGYSFRLQPTRYYTAAQLLDVLEELHREISLTDRRIALSHMAEATVGTVQRITKLGGGVVVLDDVILTGDQPPEPWEQAKAGNALPLRAMLNAGLAVGAGTDAFLAGNYSPMAALWWLITGKTMAGAPIRDQSQNLTREQALRIYTMGSAWLTSDEGRKGSIEVGKLADLAVLDGDYLTIPEERIRSLQSVLTMVGGRVVYAARPFAQLEAR